MSSNKNNLKCHLLNITIFLAIGIQSLHAQEAVSAAGGTITGNGGSISYTAGQVAYSSNKSISGTISEGVQQSFEITIITQVPEAKDISLGCSVYPNPATDFLTLKVENYPFDHLTYELFNADGQLLLSENVKDTLTTISVETLTSAIYFLKMKDKNAVIKTFKIVKN